MERKEEAEERGRSAGGRLHRAAATALSVGDCIAFRSITHVDVDRRDVVEGAKERESKEG